MRLPLWIRISALTVVAMCLLSAALTWNAISTVRATVVAQLAEAQRVSLRSAAALLEETEDGTRVDYGRDGTISRIEAANWPSFASAADADHSFIDLVGTVTGETATLFAYDETARDFVRRTTNIIKPDGERAVGTYLGEASSAYGPLMAGERYLGSAVILGKSYLTLYEPIFAVGDTMPSNAAGVAGILYVGVSDAVIGEATRSALVGKLLLSLGATVVAGILIALACYRFLRPLRAVTDDMRKIASGATLETATKRKDEVGDLLRGLSDLSRETNTFARRAQMIEQASLPAIAASAADDGTITFANPAARDFYARLRRGAPQLPAELVGSKLADIHPDGRRFASAASDRGKLPISQTVELGEERVVFAVSALTNRDGSFAGPQITLSSVTEKDAMARDFETQVSSLLHQVEESLASLKERTAVLEEAASSGHECSSEAAALAGDTAEAVQTVASAVEELNGSFAEVSERIAHNAAMAREAASAVEGAAEASRSLEAAGKRIREVITLIEDVAEQTNLLALNATIEASRAGEAGRGFAVVAAEVKSLAERAATATSEIASEVDRVNQVGAELLRAVSNVEAAIQSVDEVSANVAAAVNEQQVTTDEISRTVGNVASSATQVRTLSETVTASSGKTGEAADAVSQVTRDLDTVNRELGERAERFLQSVRHAA